MPTPAELERKFWKHLRSDMTLMLGLAGREDGHTRPMTAIVDGDADHGPLWFFTSTDSEIVKLGGGRATAAFVSKGHDLFATIHGTLAVDTNPAVVDRLWNSHVAAWYEGGKTDPKLALLRLDLESAEIWEDASSIVAGLKSLFGSDPKSDYKDKVAEVPLR